MFLFSSQVHNKSSSHFPTCFILSHWSSGIEKKNRRTEENKKRKKKEIMDPETLFFPIETILLSPLPFYNNNDAELVADDNTALSPPKASHIKQSSLASILSPDKKKEKRKPRVTSVVANKSQQRDSYFFAVAWSRFFHFSREMITTRVSLLRENDTGIEWDKTDLVLFCSFVKNFPSRRFFSVTPFFCHTFFPVIPCDSI